MCCVRRRDDPPPPLPCSRPYVNGSQWGAWVICTTSCDLPLPLPHVGTASVVVAVLSPGTDRPTPGFTVGAPLPSAPLAVSNTLAIAVAPRAIVAPFSDPDHQVIMEWEPWFTAHNDVWTIGEAVPVLGWYDSFNLNVLKQHCIWMVESGVTTIMVDWTNNAW